MRALRYVLPLCAAPLLASCVLLLDYDKLQSDGSSGGSDGNGGVQAASGAAAGGEDAATGGGNAGGAGASCGDCDDGDPCTTDSCDVRGDTPSCKHAATEGLQLDGFDATLTADQHVRVSLVGSGQLFYLAELEIDNKVPSISLYRLANDGAALEPMGQDLRLDGSPVSNVGLAIEELAAGEVALHGFVATKLKLADAAARVFHVVSRNDKATLNLVGASYRADNLSVFPQALTIGGKVTGAWIQADGTIGVHNVGTGKTDTFGDTKLPATTLALLSTQDDQPAVMFTVQSGTQATYVETSGQNRVKVVECEAQPGNYVSSSVISTQLPGLWLASITRAGDSYLTTGGATLVCGSNVCAATAEDCVKNPPPNALRNVAGATVHFDADAVGIVYSVAALPQVVAKPDDPAVIEGKLSLALGRTDFTAKPIQSSNIGGDPTSGLLEIANNDTDEASAFAGPDWPAVAILPSAHVAVAWIQPNAAAGGTELHVQRYKMCLPSP